MFLDECCDVKTKNLLNLNLFVFLNSVDFLRISIMYFQYISFVNVSFRLQNYLQSFEFLNLFAS